MTYNGHPVEQPRCASCECRRIRHTLLVSHGHVRIPDGHGGFVGELMVRCSTPGCDCKQYVPARLDIGRTVTV